MALQWTRRAHADLGRIHAFVDSVNPTAALRAVRLIVAAVRRIPEHPRLGTRLAEFGPREVRRLVVLPYEIRYEVREENIFILRIWHLREER